MSACPWIVSALTVEVKTIKQEMEIEQTVHLKPAVFYQGRWRDLPLGLLVSGFGPDRMKRALNKMETYGLPSRLCHIGFAGGTSPLMGVGKLLVANQIKERQGGQWNVAEEQLSQAKNICTKEGLTFECGTLLTVPYVVADSMEKAALGSEERALALDMESSIVAEWATHHQIPFSIVRAILDPLEMTLPDFSNAFHTAQPHISDFIFFLAKNPKQILKIPQLQYCAHMARTSLTEFAAAWSRLT